jgi:hypothetical protein
MEPKRDESNPHPLYSFDWMMREIELDEQYFEALLQGLPLRKATQIREVVRHMRGMDAEANEEART